MKLIPHALAFFLGLVLTWASVNTVPSYVFGVMAVVLAALAGSAAYFARAIDSRLSELEKLRLVNITIERRIHDVVTSRKINLIWQQVVTGVAASIAGIAGLLMIRGEFADRWPFLVLLAAPFAVTAFAGTILLWREQLAVQRKASAIQTWARRAEHNAEVIAEIEKARQQRPIESV